MKKLTKILSLVLVLALALGVFAACGKKDGGTTNPANPDGKGGTADAVVKTVDINLTEEEYAFGVKKGDEALLKAVNDYIAKIKADGTLDTIMAKYFSGEGEPALIESAAEDSGKDQLVVATNAEFPPFEYMEGSAFTGIDMEIMKGLADELGKELVIKETSFDSIFNSMDADYADIAASGITVKEDRKDHVTFSDTYYTASQMIIAPAGDTAFDNCKTKEDAEAVLKSFGSDVIIGVQAGTTGELYVLGEDGFEKLNCTCKSYESGAQAAADMVNGNIQYVIIDEAPAKAIAASINEG